MSRFVCILSCDALTASESPLRFWVVFRPCEIFERVPLWDEKIPEESLIFLGASRGNGVKAKRICGLQGNLCESLLNPWLEAKSVVFGQKLKDLCPIAAIALYFSLIRRGPIGSRGRFCLPSAYRR